MLNSIIDLPSRLCAQSDDLSFNFIFLTTEPPAEIPVGERPRDETPDDPEVIKALVRRHIEETWNKHNPDFHDKNTVPNGVWHRPSGNIIGIEAGKEVAVGILTAIPDIHITIEDLIAEGDTAAVRFTIGGTFAPTELPFEVTATYFYRFVDGLITDVWENFDDLSF